MKTGPGNVSDEFLCITSLQQINVPKVQILLTATDLKIWKVWERFLDNNQNQQCFPC